MKSAWRCWLFVGVFLFAACSSSGGDEQSTDTKVTDESGQTDVVGDATLDVEDDQVNPDASGDVTDDTEDVEVGPQERYFTFMGMGGVSMGASAFTFHVGNPGYIDFIGAYGGYINYYYLQGYMRTAMFAGFCDMDTILAHLNEINDPDSGALKCGPVGPRFPWEFAVDFNHWHFDNSGGTWDRDFYWEALEGMSTAFGNLINYNPDNPYLPAGVPLEWLAPGDTTERCANAYHVGKPYNYNAEYNPEGEYDLITFCDGEEPIGFAQEDPRYWELAGVVDPTYTHKRPTHLLLAVDYNGNGLRDFHEPVIVNTMERFEDVGADGCADANEDGDGGCTAEGATGDPNGDNFEYMDNPMGTEGNIVYDEGEPYNDYGLDGVADTDDYGEGDGEFSSNPNMNNLIERSAVYWIDHAPVEEINAVDIFMDGGIRDALHACTSTWQIAQHLAARVGNTRFYRDYTMFEDSLYPAMEHGLLTDYPVDYTPESIGKNWMVAYGNPDATESEIWKGDGKHVGTGDDVYNRSASMFMTPLDRWPNVDKEPVISSDKGAIVNSSFYSPGTQNRWAYSIATPPGYSDPAFQDEAYPVFIFLPGHGVMADSAIAAGLVFNKFMELGMIGKFMLAVPEGQCCRIHVPTGKRYCACRRNNIDNSKYFCVDPDCTGPDSECAEIQIPRDETDQECNGGNFFANQRTNKYGDTSASEYMHFEDILLEMIAHIRETYRVPEAGWFEVK